MDDGPLSGTTGAVLDPIFALRTRVRLEPGQSASVAFTTLVATSRERAFELADRYHDPHAAQRALDLAWTSSQVELRELGITPADAAVFQELAGHPVLRQRRAPRRPQPELRRNRGSQPLLWANGVSGDWPILLATIDSAEGLPTLRQLLAAHRYWRRRGMMVDLVVLNAHPSELLPGPGRPDHRGGLRHRGHDLDRQAGRRVRPAADQLDAEELLMLRATARVHIACDGRSLGRDPRRRRWPDEPPADELDEPALEPPGRPARSDSRVSRAVRRIGAAASRRVLAPLGATPLGVPAVAAAIRRSAAAPTDASTTASAASPPDGDYEIRVDGDRGAAGAVVQRDRQPARRLRGHRARRRLHLGREQLLLPAHAVAQRSGQRSGRARRSTCGTRRPASCGAPTPGPIREDAPLHRPPRRRAPRRSSTSTAASRPRLTLGMAEDAPVKIALLRVTNRGDRPRRLTLTTYVEWTLGVLREHTQHQVRTAFDREQQARSSRGTPSTRSSPGWTAFHAMSEPVTGYTADRREFLGRNGTRRGARGARRRAAPLERHHRRGHRSLRRAAVRARAGSRARRREIVDPARRRRGARAQRPRRRWPRIATSSAPRPPSTRTVERWDERLSVDHGADAGAHLRRDAQPVDALPGARLPHVGAARRSTRAAAPTASATSSRT